MDTHEAGREVVREHRELEALFGEVRAALEQGEAGAAERALRALVDALDAHFQREDALYYPTVAALRPAHRTALGELETDHDGFRARFDRLTEVLRDSGTEAASRQLRDIASDFADHEAREEALLASL